MAYLTKGEIAALTYQSGKAEVVSPAMLVSNIGSAASGIVASLLTAFAGSTLDSLKPRLIEYLGRNINTAQLLSSQSMANIPVQIESVLNEDYINIIDLMKAGIGQGVGGVHASLYETLNGVNALLNSYEGLIQRIGIDPFISRWVNSTIRPNIPDARTTWFMHNIGALDDGSYIGYMNQNGWDDSFRSKLEMAWITPIPISLIFELLRRKTIDIDTANGMLSFHGYVGVMNSWISSLAVQVPEPYRLADMLAKHRINAAEAQAAFTWFGMDLKWLDSWSATQQLLPNFSQLIELLWRKVLSEDEVRAYLGWSGLSDAAAQSLLALQYSIPPSQDLVMMVVREAWEPAMVTPAPEIFATHMAMRGFNKDWSDRYWTAHWLPMPISYAYDNLRRGLWDEAKFLDLLRIADIHPRWRQDILNVAYMPPSIRELGYGFDVGAYTQDDIVMYRRWGGLSEKDAKKSAQALVDYRLEGERNSIRTAYMNLYINNAISRDDFSDALKELRTNADAIPLWLERSDLLIQLKQTEASVTEPRNITRADAQWLFENGLRDEAWFRSTLDSIGYSEESIDAYVDQSKKRIQDKIPLPPKLPVLVLNLSQLTNLYYAEIINEAGLTDDIKGLGYNDADTKAIVKYIKFNAPIPKTAPDLTLSDIDTLYQFNYYDENQLIAQYEKRGYTHDEAVLKVFLVILSVNIPLLKTQYGNAWIDEPTMFESIKKLGIPQEKLYLSEERVNTIMTTIVKNYQAQRVATEKDLTKAEIIKGVKGNVLTAPEGVQLLQQLGYSAEEAQYLLAINKIVVSGDPQGYWQMRQTTELYKKSQKLPYVDIPNELIILEAQLKQAIATLNLAKQIKDNDIKVAELAVAVANIQAQMNTITSKLNIK
jgi:hypothetical protein